MPFPAYIVLWTISLAMCIMSLMLGFKKRKYGNICVAAGLILMIVLILPLRGTA